LEPGRKLSGRARDADDLLSDSEPMLSIGVSRRKAEQEYRVIGDIRAKRALLMQSLHERSLLLRCIAEFFKSITVFVDIGPLRFGTLHFNLPIFFVCHTGHLLQAYLAIFQANSG